MYPRFSHLDYVDEATGQRGMRVQFYLQGTRKRGTAQVDVREVKLTQVLVIFSFEVLNCGLLFQDSSGSMNVRYILVQADDLMKTTVIVEDNR